MSMIRKISLKIIAAFVLGIVATTGLTVANFVPTPLLAQTQSQSSLNSIQADHIMLRVPNFEETMQWYKDKFGFKEVIRWKEPSLPGVDLAYLELNGFRLEILGGGEPQQAIADPADIAAHTQFQGYRHLCFRTDDVDAILAELNRRGVPIFAEAYDYQPIGRRLAFVLDNNDNAIEFSGPMKSKATTN
ncbi:VOC family protein [Leptolyngbya sp. FACHB-261]|uniref:VOC family protein n=1 Tax=Leptolyngbya sp. FACHB-261 TaxID=2692806 RepID=UPI001685FDD6|nr:VOC family protein [Leptolyngbya sp. FACHB-261]MBD2100987.1 VOC family protein [Leptolyngbya sp. FACHB-261]